MALFVSCFSVFTGFLALAVHGCQSVLLQFSSSCDSGASGLKTRARACASKACNRYSGHNIILRPRSQFVQAYAQQYASGLYESKVISSCPHYFP